MLRTYLDFIRAVSLDRLGRIGVVLTTTAFISFIVLQLAMLAGIVTNAYVGLIVYLLFPILFVLGLVIIPIAWYRQKKRTGLTSSELLEQRFGVDGVKSDIAGSKVFRTVAILTLANILILGAASIKMLHFMDSPRFCGTACHAVMSPEWTTYQASPHARVACVDCHVPFESRCSTSQFNAPCVVPELRSAPSIASTARAVTSMFPLRPEPWKAVDEFGLSPHHTRFPPSPVCLRTSSRSRYGSAERPVGSIARTALATNARTYGLSIWPAGRESRYCRVGPAEYWPFA